MEEPKIQLSANEFFNALRKGICKDKNGHEKKFGYQIGEDSYYYISNVEVSESIPPIDNVTFNGQIKLHKCKIKGLYFMNCTFIKSLSFNASEIENISFFNTKADELFLDYSATNSLLSDGNTSFKQIVIYECAIHERLNLDYTTIETNLHIYETELKIVQLSKLRVLHFKLTSCKIESLSVPDVLENGTLNLDGVLFNKITTGESFSNLGYIKWNKIFSYDEATLEITSAVMGKWDIVNCDFSKARMIIYSSKITDAFYTHTKFPKVLTEPSNIDPSENIDDILSDGYNQLKTIAQKQNDRKLFLHFQAAELRSYHKTLAGDKKHRATRFQLWAMKKSNDYGTDWVKGLRFIIASNILFVLTSLILRHFQFDCKGIGNFIVIFLSFLSPLTTLPKSLNENSNWEVSWFLLSRIPLAFGIYQTIAAFRKFGKSE